MKTSSRSSSVESLLEDHLSSRAKLLFSALDHNKSGYIEREELWNCCNELSAEEFENLFKELDVDSDGLISAKDFQQSFCAIRRLLWSKRSSSHNSNASSQHHHSFDALLDDRNTANAAGDEDEEELSVIEEENSKCLDSDSLLSDEKKYLERELSKLSCQEQVCNLYETLSVECPQLLEPFESIIHEVIKDISSHQNERDRLEGTFRRAKEAHEKHMSEMVLELDAQISKIEEKVRKQERDRLEQEYADLVKSKCKEIEVLQELVSKTQEAHTAGLRRVETESLKFESEIIQKENELIKAELIEAETKLALSKTDLLRLSNDHKEKCEELDSEKNALLNFIKEQERLEFQLNQLYHANRELHDTNDDLRSALESHQQSQFAEKVIPVVDYVNQIGCFPQKKKSCVQIDNLPQVAHVQHQDSFEVDSMPGELDSGHSTLRDIAEIESEDNSTHHNTLSTNLVPFAANKKKLLTKRFNQGRYNDAYDTETTEAPEDTDFDSESETIRTNKLKNSRLKSQSLYKQTSNSRSTVSSTARFSRHARNSRQARMPAAPSGPPERVFKIVLAGDAAVGKSTFITHLCDGKFVGNLTSTLGVDFKTKIVDVDGHIFALQLWDTAGQERFRSIAKTYFRRADGVMLLYDCTYERSFLSVREWVDIVADNGENIPIMIVANKIDLRKKFEHQGRKVVDCEDGKRLAQECDSLFIECSSLDGSNILESVTELARLLRAQEDLNVSSASNVHLTSNNKSASASTCCKF